MLTGAFMLKIVLAFNYAFFLINFLKNFVTFNKFDLLREKMTAFEEM